MKLLEGKWALITGSSRGVGRQIAVGLAERKANIIVHGREKSHKNFSAWIPHPSGWGGKPNISLCKTKYILYI